jgi:hypothetical protein
MLTGDLPAGAIWAAVDKGARFVTPATADRRFAALLSPSDEASARCALVAAGACDVREYAR